MGENRQGHFFFLIQIQTDQAKKNYEGQSGNINPLTLEKLHHV